MSSFNESFFFFFNLFIYLWLCWVFVSVRGLSLVVASRGHSSSWCAGLSLSWPLVAEHRLQTRRLSNCGSRAQLLCGMWDPPRPGLEPVSPALAGRFSTTAPPGKPLNESFYGPTPSKLDMTPGLTISCDITLYLALPSLILFTYQHLVFLCLVSILRQ